MKAKPQDLEGDRAAFSQNSTHALGKYPLARCNATGSWSHKPIHEAGLRGGGERKN